MAKTAKAPQGLYSASEAIRKLKVPKSTFYEMVEKRTIKKVTMPGRSDSYYLKAAIDSMAKARELFAMRYASDQPTFSKASEADVKGIYEVALSLWGTRGTYPLEQRLARYNKKPAIYYTLKYLDIVLGFSTLMPVSGRAIHEIMQTGKSGYEAIRLRRYINVYNGRTHRISLPRNCCKRRLT